ncbi:hypothetical protein ABQE70_13640 [Xanthomonas campestris pv. campestris]|uniref:hypothetical protein n=1 Tax=Xanthomonas campestris TaxID=339 RepID=UPI000E32CBC0|nr:hypothetical protein [Xanthomonas campestris]MEA9490157.1 hypothetical protein [Xanthomonas campestris]MEA9509126.1 hypothetical protein [Xanthomonas campestris]MEA9575450.1 hypothetical protein [Xanthomonas campestris]MEB2112461.1 hypothetical protein [Xanthomonas campestris pv. campestris]RFF50549.1 hypothetical protein D0A35_08725 [Xanthomonas campestris]
MAPPPHPPTSLFEQLCRRVATSADPWEAIEAFERDLLRRYPDDGAEAVELVMAFASRLGLLSRQALDRQHDA